MKYFFFGAVRPDPSGEKRVTHGRNYVVVGGTSNEHKEAAEITRLVEEGIRMDGIHCAGQVLKDAVRKVKG